MQFLHTEIGSAKDNQKSPVHNWYKFTAGFSYKFVEEIIRLENLDQNRNAQVFDPFAGCGTTLVSCQKSGVKAVGNEAQAFMFNVIKAKLNWQLDEQLYRIFINHLSSSLELTNANEIVAKSHPLLSSLYEKQKLIDLYNLRDTIDGLQSESFRVFFKLALSQTLHKTSIHPIAVPYISRNKTLKNDRSVWEIFSQTCKSMFDDSQKLAHLSPSSTIYYQDSREPNVNIKNGQCDVCITSPPYLNNLDYGEVSKVHTHFFEITNSWNDITNNVRSKLVTGSTTHYKESEFRLDEYLKTEFSLRNEDLVNKLIVSTEKIKAISKDKGGKKSFDILTFLYFKDMYNVLLEIRRVIKKDGKAYLILGDSAPYGIFVPRDRILCIS